MSNAAERHAWHQFREVMARRQAEFDGQVPVALLIATACPGRDVCPVPTDPEEVRVHLDGALAVLRPPGMDAIQMAEMLERAAADLRVGK